MGVNENYLFGSFNRISCVDILGEIVYNLKVIVNFISSPSFRCENL